MLKNRSLSPGRKYSHWEDWALSMSCYRTFEHLTLHGNSTGLLFHFDDNPPLTKSKFTSKFRDLLIQAGIDSSLYAGHSFRIGAASTAAAKGVEDSLIQTLGRWKSSAYLLYVRLPPDNLAAISRIIAN